jgi:hypothetical protein
VRDRRSERPGRCPLDVHIDPLVIAGDVGQRIDRLLVERDPVAHAEVGTDCGVELGNGVEDPH